MTDGGGALVIRATTSDWPGAGQHGSLRDGGQDYLRVSCVSRRGRGSRLFISTFQ
jgi:hypothetical protein